MVQTDPGYSTFFTSPMHQPPSPLKAIDAVVDTDNYFTDGLSFVFNKKEFSWNYKTRNPNVSDISI